MIVLENVTKIYDKKHRPALDKLDLNIDQGEFVVLMGESGAGKSTLLKLITGEEKPSTGIVLIDGIDVGKLKSNKIHKLRRHIGVVFQDFKLLSSRTVYENVSLGFEVVGSRKKEIKQKVPLLLETVGIPEKQDSYPHELSGGQKQRVAIARALSQNPAILIADEPTGNLDKRNSLDIISLLLEINANGTTVILTTHNQEIVERLRKRVVLLEEGKVIGDYPANRY